MKAIVLSLLSVFVMSASATVQYSFSGKAEPGDVNCEIVFQDHTTQTVSIPANNDEKQAMNLIKTIERLGLLGTNAKAAVCSTGILVNPEIGQTP